MKKIAFIGVGIMGKSMVRNLMKADFELHIYARRKEKWRMSSERVPSSMKVSRSV